MALLSLLGPLLLITTAVLPLVNMGFRSPHHGPPVADVFHFSALQLWALNLTLGLVGGVLIVPRRFIVAGISGLVASAVVTGSALLYFSWRQSVEMFEILLPLGLGAFAGVQLYGFLEARFSRKGERVD